MTPTQVHSTEDLAPTAMLIREINGVLALLGIRSVPEQPKCDCYHSHLYPGKALKWIKRKHEETRSYCNTDQSMEECMKHEKAFIGWWSIPDLNACWPSLRNRTSGVAWQVKKKESRCMEIARFIFLLHLSARYLHGNSISCYRCDLWLSAEVPLSLW